MSDAIVEKKPTETLVRKTIKVVVADTEFTISTFKFLKLIRTFSLLSELTALADIAGVAKNAISEDSEGNVNLSLADVISKVLTALPVLLSKGTPTVYKLVGLIITDNKALKELEKREDVDVDETLYARGLDLAGDADPEEIFELINAATQVLGVETLIKAFRPLMGLLR